MCTYLIVNRNKAKRSAVKQLLDTFFSDSPDQVVAGTPGCLLQAVDTSRNWTAWRT